MCHFIHFSPLINIKLFVGLPFSGERHPPSPQVSLHGHMTSRSPSGLVCACVPFHSQSLKLSKRLEAITAVESPHFSIGGFRSLSLILLFQPQSTHRLGAHSAAGPLRSSSRVTAGLLETFSACLFPCKYILFSIFKMFLKVLVIVYVEQCVWCPVVWHYIPESKSCPTVQKLGNKRQKLGPQVARKVYSKLCTDLSWLQKSYLLLRQCGTLV